MIGLSGLITPSLDEMVHVAEDGAWEFEIPPLIAAPRPAASIPVKIAPHFHQAVVHVVDASRAISVVSGLTNPESRSAFRKKLAWNRKSCAPSHRPAAQKLVPGWRKRGSDRPPIEWKPEDVVAP